ncbi:MAG: DUF1080 domain-containing protein, partial [Gemmataceae bacterium]|nr:DUF1080 domain-containing protein [Gemmataceae bacterium]
RNLKLKELPSTNPKPDEVAKVWEGHTSLFTGLDLAGWKTEDGAWKAAGGVLKAAGTTPLASEKEYGPGELVYDWRVPEKAGQGMGVEAGGKILALTANPGKWTRQVVPIPADARRGRIAFNPSPGLEVMNVFYREAK